VCDPTPHILISSIVVGKLPYAKRRLKVRFRDCVSAFPRQHQTSPSHLRTTTLLYPCVSQLQLSSLPPSLQARSQRTATPATIVPDNKSVAVRLLPFLHIPFFDLAQNDANPVRDSAVFHGDYSSPYSYKECHGTGSKCCNNRLPGWDGIPAVYSSCDR
jgi:hypothetical protein